MNIEEKKRKAPYNYLANLAKARSARFKKPRKAKLAVTLSIDEDQLIRLKSLYQNKPLSAVMRIVIKQYFDSIDSVHLFE